MDREPGEEILFRGHPSWLSMLPLVIRGLVASLVVGIAAGLASAIVDGPVQTGWVIVGVALVLAIVFLRGHARRMRVTYCLTDRRVSIETGLVARSRYETRLEHIEDVIVRQSLLERALGTGTVWFDTAGELGPDVWFAGVDDPRRLARAIDDARASRRPRSPELVGRWA